MSEVKNSIEPRSFARKTIEYEHAEIHEGNAYDVDIEFTLSTTNPLYLLIETGNEYIHLKDFSFAVNKPEVKMFLYKETNASGTSSISIHNADDDSPKVTTLKLYSQPTVVSEGTLRKVYYATGAIGNGNSLAGESHDPMNWELILKKNSKYLIKILRVVSDGNTNGVFRLRYYEED
jgi:hypothetical protein